MSASLDLQCLCPCLFLSGSSVTSKVLQSLHSWQLPPVPSWPSYPPNLHLTLLSLLFPALLLHSFLSPVWALLLVLILCCLLSPLSSPRSTPPLSNRICSCYQGFSQPSSPSLLVCWGILYPTLHGSTSVWL